ncbi:MAG: RCC1 domain-containing protein [Myxococcota bacterium]
MARFGAGHDVEEGLLQLFGDRAARMGMGDSSPLFRATREAIMVNWPADPQPGSIPGDVIGLSSGVSTIAAGSAHGCAKTSVGRLKCRGSNSVGQPGNGLMALQTSPVAVAPEPSVTASLGAASPLIAAMSQRSRLGRRDVLAGKRSGS